jgi:asparagine synthase (glutamine-hydrolysing)
MCGIAGFVYSDKRPPDPAVLREMTRALVHRGPDEEGYHAEDGIALGQRRLSIIDLAGGRQPIYNEDGTIAVVFNGEIFDYVEIRAELEALGHRFKTKTDTEVIVHGYEEWGLDFPNHLNGQFAIAVWDEPKRRLILARDRVGIRPLFHATAPDGALLFASEMKALFRYPGLKAEMDPRGLGQIFTFWANVPPRTVFKGVSELPPGHVLVAEAGSMRIRAYWKHRFPDRGGYEDHPESWWTERLRALLHDATALQLRADVPVGSYLSGGLDSSIIASLVKRHHNPGLTTFSVGFADPAYDERAYQKQMAEFLGTDHHILEVDYADIGEAFSDVVRFAEKPMTRTAPAPLMSLSGLVRKHGMKVVLTGEGADEIFGGYNIFREDKIRRFWARSPEAVWRSLPLSGLYGYVEKNPAAGAFWRQFFKRGLTDVDHPYYSHLIRWRNTSWIKGLLAPAFREGLGTEEELIADLDASVDPEMRRWHPLCRAQYLEMAIFMSGYLLCSQGDRMLMAHSVEGRFPFLDHRLIEFAATIPPKYKVKTLTEKYILKKAYADVLPPAIVNRPKHPYRAPISRCFSDPGKNLAASLLTPEALQATGYFDPQAATRLLDKARQSESGHLGEREEMGVVAMASTQLLHHHFLS